MGSPEADFTPAPPDETTVTEQPLLTEPVHTAANNSVLARGISRIWDKLAAPLVEHVYGPIAEQSRTAGIVAVNTTLTAPRIAEAPLSCAFVKSVENGQHSKAAIILLGKMLLKGSDGLDGSVARATGTSTEFGAGFDPAVDIMGSASDVWASNKLAKIEGDNSTLLLDKVGIAIDAAAVVVGGVINTAAAHYAKKHGIQLEKHEEPKATTLAKAKFALKAAGSTVDNASRIVSHVGAKKVLHGVGIVLKGASIAAGAASIIQYGKSARAKIRKVRELSAA